METDVMEKFTHYKRLFIRLALLALFVFIAVFGIDATWDTIASEKEVNASLETRLALLTKKEAILRSLSTESFLFESKSKLDEAISSVINLPLILATLQKIATDSEVALKEFSLSPNASVISFLPIEDTEKLSSFTFNVNLDGSFDHLEAFISKLGLVSPLLTVEKITFSQDKTKAAINFYFKPVKLAKQSLDTPLSKITDEQRKVLGDVLTLKPPVLEEPSLASSSSLPRENPFR